MIDDYKYMYLYKPLYMDVYIKDCIDIQDFFFVWGWVWVLESWFQVQMPQYFPQFGICIFLSLFNWDVVMVGGYYDCPIL